MGFFKAVAKNITNSMAFERGKQGEAPPVWTDPELQAIADKAYKAGQEARQTEILATLDKKIKEN